MIELEVLPDSRTSVPSDSFPLSIICIKHVEWKFIIGTSFGACPSNVSSRQYSKDLDCL